jgi:hypothetical protein
MGRLVALHGWICIVQDCGIIRRRYASGITKEVVDHTAVLLAWVWKRMISEALHSLNSLGVPFSKPPLVFICSGLFKIGLEVLVDLSPGQVDQVLGSLPLELPRMLPLLPLRDVVFNFSNR